MHQDLSVPVAQRVEHAALSGWSRKDDVWFMQAPAARSLLHPAMKSILLLCIGLYQRCVSPHKGFACAYRVHRRKPSCSQLGFRAVRRFGAIGGMGVLRVRLACCGDVYRAHHPAHHPTHHWHHAHQRGSCDAPCDIPCDGSEFGKGLDACQCCDCSHGSSKQRKRASSGPGS
jgi:uncharacterized protein